MFREKIMSILQRARKQLRRNATSPKKTRPRNTQGSGYAHSTLMQCPEHHVNYVLRRSTRAAPTLLIYDCPEVDCLITLQISAK
jgi:hypothetical protein